VTEEYPQQHQIHSEWCLVDEIAAAQVNETHRKGNRIIAVGTTSVRALESAARHAHEQDIIGSFTGATDLLILPGYSFRVVDAMITNFHLPRSTLIMLVSAFTGRDHILEVLQAGDPSDTVSILSAMRC
jgi:S-adenosylmethionine:tRNA ribosyltransferase-isomerase